jgi:lysozyme
MQYGGNVKTKTRTLVASLTLSAAAFVGLLVSEGYTDQAVIPVKGDVWTNGFGSTKHPDGMPVKAGDRTTPVRALIAAHEHVSKEEERFRASMSGVLLHQAEYDLYMDWVYQYGIGAWNKSSIKSNLLKGDYGAACDALLKYKFVAGRDCSVRSNGCYGVWTRQQERHSKCMGAQ